MRAPFASGGAPAHKLARFLALFASVAASAPATLASPLPSFLFIMVDDFGWANIGVHASSQPNAAEVQTPNMDALAAEGLLLNRHYAARFCSPSRSAFHTGRNPIHVNVLNDPLALYNASDPVSGAAAIPRNMSTLPRQLRDLAGYATVGSGKWHCGLATPRHTPHGRGYEQSLFYLDGANDYWTAITTEYCEPPDGKDPSFTDLFLNTAPAYGHNNSWACSQANQPASCIYGDDMYTNFTLAAIRSHVPTKPLFVYYAPHNVHEPLEVPAATLAKFNFITANCSAPQCAYRQAYAAKAYYVDSLIGEVIAAVKARGLWDNMLVVLSADNGGPIYRNGRAGGNNWPLRGGKKSNWEGGVRVNALVSGGLLPAARRGATENGFTSMEDFYTTFLTMAGVPEPTADPEGAAAGLPPVDGLDLWPLISGANATSPRAEVILSSAGPGDVDSQAPTLVQGIIRAADGYKLLIGRVQQNTWTGPFYPNASTSWCDTCALDCGTAAASTCLFNVLDDPTEHNELSAAHPDIVAALGARLTELQAGAFSPLRGESSPLACSLGKTMYKGFVGPFIDV